MGFVRENGAADNAALSSRALVCEHAAMPSSQPRFAVAWFAGQAILVAVWWVWLWLHPAARRWFLVADWPSAALLVFALPDAVVLIGGSALAAFGRWRGRAWAQPAAWFVAGGATYATSWCLAASLATGTGWLATVLMLASAAGTLWCTRRHP